MCKSTNIFIQQQQFSAFPFPLDHASRKVQFIMAHLFTSSEEHDERIDDE